MSAALYGGTTMGAMIVAALRRYPDRIAFVDGEREVTYAQFARLVGQAVAQFDALGIEPGDTVAQLSGNRPEVYALIGAVYLRAMRSVTLHGMGSAADHAFVLADSQARILVVDPAYVARAEALRGGSPVEHWYAHGEGTSLADFWAEAAQREPAPLDPLGEPETIVRLAYTGGTTGSPKGVMLSNRSLIANTLQALAGQEWPDDIRFLCPTPISHGAGSLLLPTLWHGGTIILQRGFDAAVFLAAVQAHRATLTFLVPTMIYALLDSPALASADTSSLHTIIYGAAPMTPARLKEALAAFGPVLVQGYGQTEAPNTILTMSRADHLAADARRLESAGRPYPGIDVRLLDDDGVEVPTGQPGEICVRGPLVMSGYWRRPEETTEALRGDWLHTGDVAVRDEAGFFYIVDRKKDMIVSGGFNVFPGEVERVVAAHPAVAAIGVIGIPDERWGEAVKAVVVVRPGARVTAEEIVALVRAEKGSVSAPKSVDFVDALPLTALGKPDKKALRARYWGVGGRNVN